MYTCPNKVRAPHDVPYRQLFLPSTMSLHSAHRSGVLSTLSRTSIRNIQPNGAALDRYSVIRNFFRSQSISSPILPPRHATTTITWKVPTPRGILCERRRWCDSYLKEVHRGSSVCQVQMYQRIGGFHMRPFSRPLSSNIALGLGICPGNTRWIHASAVRTNTGRTRDKLQPPDTRPQTHYSSPDPEEPPIPKQNHDKTCSCHNTPENYQKSSPPPPSPQSQSPQQQQGQPIDPTNPPKHLEDYSRFFRRLALSLPHPHRPTRDDFLSVANGFWQRLRIRFKWFTIKSFRKFNADDISAFVTWFLMSQTLWILVGT